MSKAKKHSIYCLNCDWELKDTHKHTDGWKCPECQGPVVPGKREGEEIMDKEQAINIAVGCVMASAVDNEIKRKVIEKLRSLEKNK